jgi:hypothetical protein
MAAQEEKIGLSPEIYGSKATSNDWSDVRLEKNRMI